MAVGNVHTLYAVDIDPITGANAVFIDQVSDWNVDTGIGEILQNADGMVDPTFVAVGSQSPRIRFSSTALATILAKCGISGLKIDSDVTHDGAEFWFQKVAEGGTRASGSNHIKMTMNEGMLLPRMIRATNGPPPATMDFEAVPTYDGTNDPLVIAASQALVGTPSVGELFTAGPVSINGSALAGIQDITIDFGIREIVQSGDGQVWPTFIGIMERRPVITIRSLEAIALSTFGLEGTAQSASDSVIYLRKIAEGGTRVADGTAEHISFPIDEGRISVNTVGGTHGTPVIAEVKITPTFDGTNAILVINTATAIT